MPPKPSCGRERASPIPSSRARNRSVSSSRPRPGPITAAVNRCAHSLICFPARSTSSVRGSSVASRTTAATVPAIARGTAIVARPAPARIAASATKPGAPIYVTAPATTSRVPQSLLCASGNRRGMRWRTSSSVVMRGPGSDGSPSPRSTTTIRPAYRLPGGTRQPRFGDPSVTVTCAMIAVTLASPVVASTPVGTSARPPALHGGSPH